VTGRALRSALAIALGAAALACGGDGDGSAAGDVAARAAEAPRAPAERIPLARVGVRALRAAISAPGTVEARRSTEIAAEVPGRIESIRVQVGDEVADGARLFRIDPGPYEMALAEAKAGLVLALAESENATAEAERMRVLLEQKAASQQRYEQLRTQAEVARARVAQAKARAARAEHDLERTWVLAPYAGSVVERRAHEGALAGSDPVLVLQESGALEAILDVPEATPVPVHVGAPVRLFVEGLPAPLETSVARVNERVDPDTRTYQVRCAVEDATGAVKAGSYVRAEIEALRETPGLVVPRSAVATRDGRSLVLRVEGDTARQTPVRVGILEGEDAEILSGLAAGDLVVHGEAAQRLADGTRLRIDGAAAEIADARAGSPAGATP